MSDVTIMKDADVQTKRELGEGREKRGRLKEKREKLHTCVCVSVFDKFLLE